jgi:hypothetical protein
LPRALRIYNMHRKFVLRSGKESTSAKILFELVDFFTKPMGFCNY